MRGVLAYDPASGRILHAHFTESKRPQPGATDPAESAVRRYLASDVADVRLVHVESNDMKRGLRYRVDTTTGKLKVASDGERGFAALAGIESFRAAKA